VQARGEIMSVGKMMLTHSGMHINPLFIEPRDIDIEDIAHALALVNRFNGHTKFPISVAQHSTFVSYLCEAHSPIIALQGLLHDASEAYIGDVITWIKRDATMAHYRLLEQEVQNRIYNLYGVPLQEFEQVTWNDRIMCDYEGHVAVTNWDAPDIGCNLLEWLSCAWYPVNWESAKSMFLKQFHKLTREIERQKHG
jgi:uncharacterized protein